MVVRSIPVVKIDIYISQTMVHVRSGGPHPPSRTNERTHVRSSGTYLHGITGGIRNPVVQFGAPTNETGIVDANDGGGGLPNVVVGGGM